MGALLNDDDDELSINSIYLAVLRVKIELCMFFYASAQCITGQLLVHYYNALLYHLNVLPVSYMINSCIWEIN